jgi:hypothetical protein
MSTKLNNTNSPNSPNNPNNYNPATAIQQPAKSGMIGSNPSESAILSQQQTGAKAAAMNKIVSRGGGDPDEVEAPQLDMPYKSTSAPGQGINDQAAKNASTAMQSGENAKYDSELNKGGSKSKKNGGNKDTQWGCYSGGKKYTKKTKKSKKMKMMKMKKSKKSKKMKMKKSKKTNKKRQGSSKSKRRTL